MGLAERHLAAGTLLSGAPLGRCRSLLPLGAACARDFGPPVLRGTPCGNATAHAPGDALPGLVGPALASACPHAAYTGQPLLNGLFPASPRGGATSSPVCPEAHAGAAPKRPARSPAAQPPARGKQWYTRRTLLGAWGAVLRQVQKPGLGHQPLLPGRPRRPRRSLGGPTLSESSAPGRAGAPGTRP